MHRLLAGAWALGIALLADASEPARFARPHLRGTMQIGSERLASLAPVDTSAGHWCRIGERVGVFTVLSIDEAGVVLLDAQGVPCRLDLPSSQVVSTNAPPTDPVEHRRWVNSRDNPMLHTPVPLPVESHRWPALPAERQQRIRDWYSAHGWRLDVASTSPGSPVSVEFAPIHGDERQAILAAKRHAFLLSLTPDQRSLYPSPDFRAFLTAPQAAAFDSLEDFTTPAPSRRPASPRGAVPFPAP